MNLLSNPRLAGQMPGYAACFLVSVLINLSFSGYGMFGIPPLKNTIVNRAPVFKSSDYSYTVADDASPGAAIGITSAMDPDGDIITYDIKSGNTNKCFAINSLSGVITVAKALNHHTQNRFVLTVRARDMAGLSTQALAVITVTAGTPIGGFDTISWGTAANQQYTVDELQGEVVNGKLYTFGGFDSQKSGFTPTSRAYVFDPAANTWTAIASMPPMNGTNYGGVTHAGFTTDGTDIYFAGGYTSNSSGTGQIFGTGEVWKYVVAENRYERLPYLPIPVAAGQLEYVGGKLHHISGTNLARTQDLGDHYVLDLDSLTKGWKKLAPLPNPRQHAGSVVYEGKIYFIGGQHGHDSKLVAQKDVHVYDPATDTWTKLADLPVPAGATGRGHISSASVVLGKYIVVSGGETVHATSRTNMVSAFTPETNTWKNLTPLPQTRYSGVAANLGGVLYYTGGSGSKVTYKGTPSIQKVQSLTLMNADNDQPLQTLQNGDTINIGTLPTQNLNIRANTSPATVGSVVFNLTGAQVKAVTESVAPYAFFGDNMKGDYYPWVPAVGNYNLSCMPYSASKGTGTQGMGVNIAFTVINKPGGVAILSPDADAYVRNGSFAAVNYGADSVMLVKSSSTVEYNRQSYIKFSLGSLSTVSTAKLRIYGGNIQSSAAITLSAYGLLNGDEWAENTITFSNAHPSLTPALSSLVINSEVKYYEFDVTDFIKAQLTGDKVASFLIKDPANKENIISFNSRENALNPPQLVVGFTLAGKPSFVMEAPPDPLLTAKVYPNPAHNIFTAEFSNAYNKDFRLQIIDMAGKIYRLDKAVVNPGTHSLQLDISYFSLSPGLYLLAGRHDNTVTIISKLFIN